MPDANRCPRCGAERPAGDALGLCPRCPMGLGIELAPDSPAKADLMERLRRQPPPWAAPEPDVHGGSELGTTHSVLFTLARSIGSVPRILLRDAEPAGNTPLVSSSSPQMPAPLSDNARYGFLGEIASGGMGAILKGHDNDLGRDLAVKVLLDRHRGNQDLIRRFIEEAQIGGQLQHPGIVPVYDLGCFDDKRPFFTMKLVKGKTLAVLLQGRPDPAHERPHYLTVFQAVCQTMAYAHARGVIHRDLKPGNVMVGAFGEVQIMDWGLAKVLRTGSVVDEEAYAAEKETVVETARSGSETFASQAGSVLGTPHYMPPEQARGELGAVDERADVFALGAILCEILTGQPPYSARSIVEVQEKAMHGDLAEALARLANCGAEAELLELARRCLAPDVNDRPRDAGAVAHATTTYLASVQERLRSAELARVEAQARTMEERKRRKAQLRMAVGILLVLTAGIAGVAMQWNRAEANFRKAQSRFDLARDAIELFYTGASEDVLLKEPQLKPLRDRLLGSALEFYKRLQASLETESGDISRAELAAAYERVGEITGQVGSFAAAIEALDQAHMIRLRLAGEQPQSAAAAAALADVLARQSDFLSEVNRAPEALATLKEARAIRQSLAGGQPRIASYRIKLAGTDVAIGRLLGFQLKRMDDALESVERALALYQELITSDPTDQAARRGLAEALNMLGMLNHLQDRWAEAAESYEKAAAIFDELAVLHPKDLEFRVMLGRTLSNAGNAATELNQLDRAERLLKRARSTCEDLVRDQPNVSQFQFHLGIAHQSIAWRLSEARRTTEAAAEYRRALQVFDRLAQEHPDVSRYVSSQGQVLSSLGNELRALGRFDEALATLKRAQAVLDRVARDNPNVTQNQLRKVSAQICTASLLNQLGRHSEAMKAYEQVLESHERIEHQGPNELYNMACAHVCLGSLISGEHDASPARRALAARHFDQGMADLRRAVEMGYRRVRNVQTDPDLNPLRARSDFQALLIDLSFPADPFAK